MIRILQVVNIMDRAGLETMLMNYYHKIDRNRIQFDFLTHRKRRGNYDKEIKILGGNIYRAPQLYPQNYISYFRFMRKFFINHTEYNIIHSHIDAMSYFPLLAAKQNEIPIRIAHSHNTRIEPDYKYPIKLICKKNICKVSNIHCACGKDAGIFMFGKRHFSVINNAIDVNKYKYSYKKREDIRNYLGISKGFVIGHVGRYNKIKNQMYLLDVFNEIHKIVPASYLLLIGKGEDEIKLRKKSQLLGITNYVRFLIDRPDVNELYNAMDVFVMPSLFEGLPVVAIEAQANGLPCFFSDNITDEACICNNVTKLNIALPPVIWAKAIIKSEFNRENNTAEIIKNSGFDICKEVHKLENWYIKLSEKVSSGGFNK